MSSTWKRWILGNKWYRNEYRMGTLGTLLSGVLLWLVPGLISSFIYVPFTVILICVLFSFFLLGAGLTISVVDTYEMKARKKESQ